MMVASVDPRRVAVISRLVRSDLHNSSPGWVNLPAADVAAVARSRRTSVLATVATNAWVQSSWREKPGSARFRKLRRAERLPSRSLQCAPGSSRDKPSSRTFRATSECPPSLIRATDNFGPDWQASQVECGLETAFANLRVCVAFRNSRAGHADCRRSAADACRNGNQLLTGARAHRNLHSDVCSLGVAHSRHGLISSKTVRLT